MSETDKYVFETSVNAAELGKEEFIYEREQFVAVNDNNFGSYASGQITFDLQAFSNSNKYFNPKRSQLLIPLCITVEPTGGNFLDAAGNIQSGNNFALSLKNGFHHFIHSMSITLTNNEVISIQPFQNAWINYKLLSTSCTDDLVNLGPTLNFEPDGYLSPYYVLTTNDIINAAGGGAMPAAPNGGGIGLCNNVEAVPVLFNANNGYLYPLNEGREIRMKNTSFSSSDVSRDELFPTFNTINFQSTNESIYKNNVTQNAAGTLITYHVLATIPLNFLSDFFDKLPLIKNSYMKLTINTNTNVTSTLSWNAAGGGAANYTNCTTTSPYGVCPYMISPINIGGCGFTVADPGATTGCVVRCGISTSGAVGAIPHPLKTCQIVGSLVDLNAVYERSYLENKVKTFNYLDIMTYDIIKNIAPNSTVDQLLTPGLSRMRRIIIVPMVSASGTTMVSVNPLGIRPMNSPFTSEPGTCSPYCPVTNLNIMLSGSCVYQQNKMYSYQNYLEECRGTGAINGGLSVGLSSGLINQVMHDANYGYIVVNLAHHKAEEDSVSKSLTVMLTNASQWTMDYLCIIEYVKTVSVDVEIGAIVM
jgi:hypothetical protein